MFTNKTPDGRNNICGKRIAAERKAKNLSQRALADNLQLLGLDIDKNAKRFVTDIELVYFARFFDLTYQELLQ